METSKVYIQTDGDNHIIRCEGGHTMSRIQNIDDWTLIDEGTGDRYNLCQTHYFPAGLTNPDQTHRYIYAPDLSPAYREATAEELAAERAEIEAARKPLEPTAAEVERLDLIQEIVEMRAQLAQIKINGGV